MLTERTLELPDDETRVELQTDSGNTALHYAAMKGHSEVVKLLVDKGADVMSEDTEGQTAMHWAVDGGHLEVIKMLVAKGADVGKQDAQGYLTDCPF